MTWKTNIGLEVHIQLMTASKLFSDAPTAFGAEPNTQACVVDLGLPGVLPVVNRKAVEMAIKFGLSVNAKVARESHFARKNYFYPDLPKNYQITQDNQPIVEYGQLGIRLPGLPPRSIEITRAHLEEDAGKSIHDLFDHQTGLDFNRAGNPLLEIVSAPVLTSAKEAVAYLKALHSLVRYLGICDGNMQEGSFRCDANVSVRRSDTEELGTRTETKNLNSFRFIERAIDYEIARQIEVLESGGKIRQQTRLYDPDAHETRAMRDKEEAHNYRYFPDPDLLPVQLDESLINRIQASMPELPWEKRERFITDYELPEATADQLVNDPHLADYFEETVKLSSVSPLLAANWVNGELTATFNKESSNVQKSQVSPADLAGLLKRIEDHTISGKIAKDVFASLWNNEGSADDIIENKNLQQITDTDALSTIIDQILSDNPSQLADYQAGKVKLFGYFVGQVMQATQGKANPAQVNALLKQRLRG